MTKARALPNYSWLIVFVTVVAALRLGANQVDITLPQKIQDLLTLSTSVVVEALPFVLLGIGLSITVQLFIPARFFTRLLPRRPLFRRAALSLLGIFLPVCECGNMPLARGLLMRGLSSSESLTFLLAAPILNPVTIIATMQAFPGDPTIVTSRIIAAFLIANTVGWLFSIYSPQQSLLTDKFAAVCEAGQHGHGHNEETKLDTALALLRTEARAMLPPLLIGSLIAGVSQTFIPREILTSLGSDPVWSITAMLALAFIISICANVDAFFALAFSGTFTPGSIVSFLVFGPMIDIKMLTLMRTTYKGWVLVLLTVVILLLSALTGLVVNYAL